MTKPDDSSPDAAYRAGAAALGMFAGMALGLLLGFLGAPLAPCVFSGAAAGVITGLVHPDMAMNGVEMTIHFFIGMFSGWTDSEVEGRNTAPNDGDRRSRWLRGAFLFGAIFAVVLALLW